MKESCLRWIIVVITIQREIKKAICDAYGNELNIFQDSIPRLEAIAETASEGISIFEYAENSKGADSYGRLAEEVLNHGKKSK